MVEDYQHEYGVPMIEIAAALGASLAQGSKPLVAKADAAGSPLKTRGASRRGCQDRPAPRLPANPTGSPCRRDIAPGKKPITYCRAPPMAKRRTKPALKLHRSSASPPPSRPDLGAPLLPGDHASAEAATDTGMEHYRIEVGLQHGVKPGNIVRAIANEAEIESEYIGRIEIFDDYSTVQLPEGMPRKSSST